MDLTTEYLSDYACSLTYEDLSPESGTPGEADAGRHLRVWDRRVRQRAGVHRAADGVSSAGESSGTHPRHRAGDVYGYWRPSRIRFLSATSTVTTTTLLAVRATRAT